MTVRGIGRNGFTLLEVLVALAVVAFAMAALWKGLGQGIAVSQGLPDRVVARWVAQNRLVLHQARRDWPAPREYRGNETMGGRSWFWEEQVSVTGQPRLRRVMVSVATTEAGPALFTLEGYLQQATAGADTGPPVSPPPANGAVGP